MDFLLAGFVYLVAVKILANLLSAEFCPEIDAVEQAQLVRLRELRDSAREATLAKPE